MSEHTEQARAIARDTGWDLDDYAKSHAWSAVAVGPVGQHRDSDALARSNFTVVYDALRERFGESVDVVNFGHWAVGLVEEIAYNAGDSECAAAVADWRERLEGYPVADEEHYSELEHKEMVEWCATLRFDCERDGVDYVPRAGLEGAELAEETARMLSDDCSRPDDAPGEEEIRTRAIESGILVPDAESVHKRISELKEDRNELAEKIADFDRGLCSLDELVRFAREVTS